MCRPLVAAILVLTLAACSDARLADRPEGAVRGYGAGTVVVADAGGLDRFNPLVATDRWTREVNRYMLFLPLVEPDGNGGYSPRLAEAWSPEGDSAIVFRIRREVRWQDGAPTTAHDVAFTYMRAMDPATGFPNGDFVAAWTGVEVVDSFTVRLRFVPHTEPLAAPASLPIAPRHLLDTVPPARMRDAGFNRAPVGNGPFRLIAWEPNDQWVFEANPDFPESLGGPPRIGRMVWRVVPEASARVAELLTSNAHLITGPPPEQFAGLAARPGIRTITRDGGLYAAVAWNMTRPPLDDARVRRALTLAIDRQALVEGLRAGFGTVAAGPIGPGHWAYDPSLEPLPHDPVAARALLVETGLVDRDGDAVLDDSTGVPFTIELLYAANSTLHRDVAQLIQKDLGEIGVRVVPRAVEFGALVDRISSPEKTFQAVLIALESDLVLDLRDLFHSGRVGGPFQLASYANPAADRLMDEAAAARSRDEAAPLYHRLLAILRDDQPWTFLYHYPELYAYNESLQGVEMDPRGALVTIQRWHLESDDVAPLAP